MKRQKSDLEINIFNIYLEFFIQVLSNSKLGLTNKVRSEIIKQVKNSMHLI